MQLDGAAARAAHHRDLAHQREYGSQLARADIG
jgi:hypothetical protein